MALNLKGHGSVWLSEKKKPCGDFDYAIDGDEAVVIGMRNAVGAVTIPAQFEGKPVTRIYEIAFLDCTELTSITLPESVRTIAESAFGNCAALETVILPKNLTELRARAFVNCRSLTHIDLPEGLEEIGPKAFSGCSGLTYIDLPGEVEEIGSKAFSGCFSLTHVGLPDGLKEIGSEAFSGCTSLTHVGLPEGLKEIGSKAFSGCTSLTHIDLPEGLKKINSEAFENCTQLRPVAVPEGTEFALDIFARCPGFYDDSGWSDGVTWKFHVIKGEAVLDKYQDIPSLETIRLPVSLGGYPVKCIPALHYDCFKGVQEIIVPEGIEALGENAFKLHGAKRVQLPEGLTEIPDRAFLGAGLQSIVIPEGVTRIGENAFAECEELTHITLPQSLTVIWTYAFLDCTALTEIDLPTNLHWIDDNAFEGCDSLKRVVIPENVTTLGWSVFEDSGIQELFLPKSLAQVCLLEENPMEPSADFLGDCMELENIFVEPGNPLFSSVDGLLYDAAGRTLIKCPMRHKGEVRIAPGTVTVEYAAFDRCHEMTQLFIPDSVEGVEPDQLDFVEVISYCRALERITVAPGNSSYASIDGILYSADKKTLRYCPDGRRGAVQIPDGTTVIDHGAFSGCKGITQLLIPKGIERISDHAFSYSSITSLTLPASLTQLGEGRYEWNEAKDGSRPSFHSLAFTGTEMLEEIHVAEGNPLFKSINGVLYTADGTVLLRYPQNRKAQLFLMPREVETIAAEAFSDCKNLTHIALWDKPYKIGKDAFRGCNANRYRAL